MALDHTEHKDFTSGGCSTDPCSVGCIGWRNKHPAGRLVPQMLLMETGL